MSRSWNLCFWSLKRFGRFEAIASLDAYQITNYQILQKFIFYYLIFEEFTKEFLNQGFSHFLSRQARLKGLFNFSKLYPLGYQVFQMVPKWKEVSIEMDSFLTMVTNSFENPVIKAWKHFFYHFFALTLWSWHLFPFLEISTKFIMTKGVQNKFIHFMQMFTSKQSLHFSRSTFTNENIHKQKTAPSWSVILMLLMTINKLF